jgi:hypothetical protein
MVPILRKSVLLRTRTTFFSRAIRSIVPCTSNDSGSYGRSESVHIYRALGTDVEDGILRIWIGTHGEYDKLVG